MLLAGATTLRTTIAAAALAIAGTTLLTVLVEGGEAGKPKTRSTITLQGSIDGSEYVYTGEVRSPKAVCERGRTVQLRNTGSPGSVQGADTTGADGTYEIRQGIDGLAGDYFTKVTRKTTPHRVCKPAVAPTIPLPCPRAAEPAARGTCRAARPHVPSTVSLHAEPDGADFVFRGRVRSERDACERRRNVRITAGHGFGGPVVEEGVAKTDSSGRYELRVKGASNTIGGYRATALRKETDRLICTIARSPVKGGI